MEISLVIAIFVLGVTTGALVAIAIHSDRKRCAEDEPTETGVQPDKPWPRR